MRNDWEPAILGDLVSIEHGWPFKSEEFSEDLTGRPIVVAVGNFRYEGGFRFDTTATKEYRGDYPKSYELAPGDTLLIMTCQTQGGEILGIPARIPDDGRTYLHNQRLGKVVVRAPEMIDSGFLYHLFRSREFNSALCATASGSKILHTAPKRIEAYEFLRPPIETQQAIAAVLGSLDDKIEQNRRTGRALEGLARATFKAWFVDFEPVKAKAAGQTSFPGMPPAAFAALPDRLTDSALGPVPYGWEVKTLEDVAEAVKGLSYKGAGLVSADAVDSSGSLPLHNLNSVYEGGGYKNEGLKRYRGEFKDRHIILPGDLIVTNTEQGHEYRLIGFPAIVPKRYGDRGLFSHHIFRVRPLLGAPIGTQFLYYAIMSARIRDEIVGCTNGTTVNMLSIDGLKRPRICIPGKPGKRIVDLFEQHASTMHELSESLYDESQKLAALRDYLLPRLLSGRVRVRQSKVEEKA